MGKSAKKPVLEDSLLTALKAVDNQIARAMERTPAEREVHGVQKWKPIDDRVERICELLLSEYGQSYQLESLLVFSRAFVKSLSMICDELGSDAFGEIRGGYVKECFRVIEGDVERGRAVFKRGEESLM
jgi:hypothetical protein